MKRLVNILMITTSIVTSIFVICTFLTSYHFCYFGLIFNSYIPVEIGTAVTVLLLGIRFILNYHGVKKIVHSLFFLVMAAMLFLLITLVK